MATQDRTGAGARTALVLGGGSDIATATLAAMAERGLRKVVLAMRDPAEAPQHDGLEVVALEWDALDTSAHPGLIDRAVEQLGRIDVVLCAVGLLGHHAGVSMGPAEVERMQRTNCAGPAAALAAIAPVMVEQGGGSIVVLSSVAAVRPRRSNYVYGSSKAGLDAFARGLADGVAGTGLEVLVVRPGFVRSSMTDGLDPAPFATDPSTVAAAIVARLGKGSGVVWVPRLLGPLFTVLSALPSPLWRRVAGDR